VSASLASRLFLGAMSGKIRRAMEKVLCYDLMLEVEGILRSQRTRIRSDRDLKPEEILDLHGRRWEIVRVDPARSLHVDRRVVAREIVEPVAPAA
jgi:hypothetical protein